MARNLGRGGKERDDEEHCIISSLKLNSSPHNIRIVLSRNIKWERHASSTVKVRKVCRILVENMKERHRMEDLPLDERIILKLICEETRLEDEIGSNWFRIWLAHNFF